MRHLTPRVVVERLDALLAEHATKLRVTANQLARGEDEKAGGIRRWHAVARLRKMADEIAPDTRETDTGGSKR